MTLNALYFADHAIPAYSGHTGFHFLSAASGRIPRETSKFPGFRATCWQVSEPMLNVDMLPQKHQFSSSSFSRKSCFYCFVASNRLGVIVGTPIDSLVIVPLK